LELMLMSKDIKKASNRLAFIDGRIDPDTLFNHLRKLSESGLLTKTLEERNRILCSATDNGIITWTHSENYVPPNNIYDDHHPGEQK
ncbi:hypothetical protein, partial [Oleiphilus sp. HI0123]